MAPGKGNGVYKLGAVWFRTQLTQTLSIRQCTDEARRLLRLWLGSREGIAGENCSWPINNEGRGRQTRGLPRPAGCRLLP